nr:putative ribonuclease H-like domain-containing protein [Tanacetum cinerariifolium]
NGSKTTASADFNNMDSSAVVNPILTHRVHIDHPKNQILRDRKSAIKTWGTTKKTFGAHALMEPKKKVWRLVDLPYGKKAIGTKRVYRNKKDERGIVVRNKDRMVAQGHRQEEGIDYDEKQEEKWIKEEQAANARYWKIHACCDDDDDYDSAITPVLSTEEPIDSLSMGDEHLDTIPATGSDEVIKSSVEDLIPIPSEFEGILDTMCDLHLVNNPTPLEAKDHVEIVMNSNDDISSSDDDSLHEENIENVEASPHDSELVSLEAA